MLERDVHLRPGIVWRLLLDAYSLECIADRRPTDQLSILRIVENGRELHVEHLRSQDQLQALSRQYVTRFQEALRRSA